MNMRTSKRWTVDILLDEDPDDRSTRAEARLHSGDPADVRGVGRSWRNPGDPEVPEIGDELAVARALADLANHLRAAAANEIEAVDGTQEASHGW
jgi:uncharacterized protein DUF1876